MSEPEIRVGDAEREQALVALGEHMSAGRLDIDEYGERTAQVATSKTRADLLALFKDLPDPRPSFTPPAKVQASPAAQPVPAAGPHLPAQRAPGARLYAALVPVAWVAAFLLFFSLARTPFVFALPVLVMMLGASIYGDEWKRERHLQRQRHREIRDRQRKFADDRRRHWDRRPRRDDYH